MRKITSSFFMSVDGVIEAPETWQFPYMSHETLAAVSATMAESDTMLLGRGTYEEWVEYWPRQGVDPLAAYMNETPKLVASTTLERVEWKNASLIAGDVAQALTFLKQLPGKDISISGSGTLVKSLLLAELVDELRLLVAPIVVGRGARLFDDGSAPRGLELIASTTFENGVVSLTYGPGGR